MPIALPPTANAAREPFGGETGTLIRAFDWTSMGLPALREWPQSLRTVVDVMMTSPVPMVLLWGPDGVMIYNDGYRVFAGGRHPRLLGSKVLEGWPEVADWNRRVMEEGLAGRTLSFRNQELTLYRHGGPEQVWMNLDYSPVFDEQAEPAGVLAIVVETSEQVRLNRQLDAERQAVADLNHRLEAERDSLRQLFDQAPSFFAVVRGPEHRFEMANHAYRRLVGGRDVVGRTLADALPEIVEQGFVRLLDQVRESGRPYVGEAVGVVLQPSSGGQPEERTLDFVYQPVRDAAGKVDAVFVQGHDVTERQRAFAALSESEERFRLTADSSPAPMWVSELDRSRQFVNKAYVAFVGGDYQSALKLDWRDILHPDDVQRVVQESVAGEASLKPFTLEGRFRRADGQYRWIRSTSQPRWNAEGQLVGFVGVAFDITESRDAADHQRLLINELNHRVKNTLATVQSLAAQSLKGGIKPEAALDRFQGRLLALSRAHDVLTRESWETASIHEIVEQSVRAWRDRVTYEGEDLDMEPRVALALSMTLHELATNAAKYGGLSTPDGGVEIRWRDGDQRLRLTWREHGGPNVQAPTTRGFGTRLIERQLSHELGGTATFAYPPEGLVCTLDAPLPERSTGYTDPTRSPSAELAAPA